MLFFTCRKLGAQRFSGVCDASVFGVIQPSAVCRLPQRETHRNQPTLWVSDLRPSLRTVTPNQFLRKRHRLSCYHSEAEVPSEEELLEVGVFLSPHGLQGEIRLQPTTDFPEQRLGAPAVRWVQAQPKRGSPPAPLQMKTLGGRRSVYKGHEVWLMRLEGVTTPEQASALRNSRLLMLTSDCHQLVDEDEFYSRELIGMRVLLQGSQSPIGTVVDVFEGTGTQNTLRVQLQDEQGTCLIPFVKEIVPEVDLDGQAMRIAPPEGLLDLVIRPNKIKPARKQRQLQKAPISQGISQAATN